MKDKYDENDLKNYLEQKNNTQIEISKTKAGIEDCFMQLMKN